MRIADHLNFLISNYITFLSYHFHITNVKGGNHFILGGALNGTRVLGDYIDTYDSLSLYMTGRGVSIPTTPNEAPWVSSRSGVMAVIIKTL